MIEIGKFIKISRVVVFLSVSGARESENAEESVCFHSWLKPVGRGAFTSPRLLPSPMELCCTKIRLRGNNHILIANIITRVIVKIKLPNDHEIA